MDFAIRFIVYSLLFKTANLANLVNLVNLATWQLGNLARCFSVVANLHANLQAELQAELPAFLPANCRVGAEVNRR
jgi:hypothetical protein